MDQPASPTALTQLLIDRTALENVELPLLLTGLSRRQRRSRAELTLESMLRVNP
jgi:predicted ABC-type transport system involved in lysophospholipase L1 biosynthesis ATPase subunit